MSLYDYFIGQQSWKDYVNNRDLATRFEKSLTKTGDRLALKVSRSERDTAVMEGLGSLENRLASGVDDLRYELQGVSSGIDNLRADFHILMGDVVWKLEVQTSFLDKILRTLQLSLDTASKELRARAEDAYRNGWYEEALSDFLASEQKNYQDFAVQRSIGNIYLYHLVDLGRAFDYFVKASKYARPRDAKQTAEAEFFVGVTCGLQQDSESALKHMREAVSLNQTFFEAHYMCASFAGLLGFGSAAAESAERAIQGDARYYERCVRDRCFEKVRSEIERLLARLFASQEAEANARITEGRQMLQQMREMRIDDATLQKHSAKLDEIDRLRAQRSYASVRSAAAMAFELLGLSLKDGLAHLEQAAKGMTADIARGRSQRGLDLQGVEKQIGKVRDEKARSVSGIWFLIPAPPMRHSGFQHRSRQ
jgi:tetratricopeptide (TPR) repeat protein